jgi:hypothetical protein
MKKPSVALVDADFLVYHVGFTTEDLEEREAKNKLTTWFTDIVYMRLQCEDYRAYITGSTNFRFDVAVTIPYKGNRKDVAKPKHYAALRKHLGDMGAATTQGEEADDAVGIDSSNGNYWIVHVDKDLNQLKGWHYNPVKDIEYYVSEFEGLYNFYTQMLVGDRVDNIQGLNGIGPVKAAKILADCTDEQQLYKAICNAYEKHGETHDRVIENARLLWLRRESNQSWSPPTRNEKAQSLPLVLEAASGHSHAPQTLQNLDTQDQTHKA